MEELAYVGRSLGAVGHDLAAGHGFSQGRQVGVDVAAAAGRQVAAAPVALAEDAYKVGDPFLVALAGQQRHDHQLHPQEHEQVAPLGLEAHHGNRGSGSSRRREAGPRRASVHVKPSGRSGAPPRVVSAACARAAEASGGKH